MVILIVIKKLTSNDALLEFVYVDNFLRTALDDTWMGVRLAFRSEHLSPSFTTMNKFILVTSEYSRYLISSLLVLTRSIQIFPTFTVATRVSSAVNPTPFVQD